MQPTSNVPRYRVVSQWAGWWGGYGSEGLIERRLNGQPGYHLISTKVSLCLWFWILPRRKLLYVFESEPAEVPA